MNKTENKKVEVQWLGFFETSQEENEFSILKISGIDGLEIVFRKLKEIHSIKMNFKIKSHLLVIAILHKTRFTNFKFATRKHKFQLFMLYFVVSTLRLFLIPIIF